MDKDSKDFKRSGKKSRTNSSLDQYTKHFNYSVFPNFKIYSLSTQSPEDPVDSASASAAADNTFPFSDPPTFLKALPSDTVKDQEEELLKSNYERHKEQHLNLQQQLEQHKKQLSEKPQSTQNQENETQRPEEPPTKTIPPPIAFPFYETTVPQTVDKLPLKPPKFTETLFPPPTAQQESSKSIFAGTFNDRWMSHNDEHALVLASGPIGDPDAIQNRVRSLILKIRGPVADYQSKNGVPIQQQISFVELIRMLFVCSQTAVFTVLTMLWNLYPLLDGFLYVIRFILDKTLHICQAETTTERTYRCSIFTGELIILLLANLFILNLIVMPITQLILYSIGNCMRLLGLH